MAERRIYGDRVFEKRGSEWHPLQVPDGPPGTMRSPGLLSSSLMPIPVQHRSDRAPAVPTPAPAMTEARFREDERPRLAIENSPVGPITIYPADYARRLPVYETAAREFYQLPVVGVSEIVHAGPLRAAVAAFGNPPVYRVLLNSLRTVCSVHRWASFQHELEHIRRGDCLTSEGYSEAKERPCREVGAREALSIATVAADRVSRASGSISVDADRCRSCSVNHDAPCGQGAAVYQAVNRALAPL